MRIATFRPATTAVVGATAALAIVLSACSSSTPSTPDANPGIDVGEPNGPTGGAGDTQLAGQEFTTQERVDMVMGSTREQAENMALEFGWNLRVGRIDDESFAVTEDYAIGRMTIELDTQGTDPAVVTRIIVELEDGPETFEA